MSERVATTAMSVLSVRPSSGVSSVTPLLMAREVRPTIEEILGRPTLDPVPPLSLMAADVFPALKRSLSTFQPRVTLARTGEIALSFSRDRRHAVLTADPDGDITLLLTDRGTEEEPEASVVGPEALFLHERIQAFLER